MCIRSQVANSVSVYYASALYLVLADSGTYTKLGRAKVACDGPEERILWTPLTDNIKPRIVLYTLMASCKTLTYYSLCVNCLEH